VVFVSLITKKAQMVSARGWFEVPLKIFTMRVWFQKITQSRTIAFTPAIPRRGWPRYDQKNPPNWRRKKQDGL